MVHIPNDNLQLVHHEQEPTNGFGRGLTIVQRYDGGHGTDTKTSDEPTDTHLHHRGVGRRLDDDTHGENAGPGEDGVAPADRV